MGEVGEVGEVGAGGHVHQLFYFLLVSVNKISGKNPDCSLANHCMQGFGEIRWPETYHSLSTRARNPGCYN